MTSNFVDIVALAYEGYGMRKGWRRGFAVELPGAISWALALFTGSGLYRWTERGMAQLSDVTGQSLGAVGLVAVLVGSYGTVRKLRARIRNTVEPKISEGKLRQQLGMIAGGCRALFLSSFFVLFLSLAPIGFLRGTFSDGSLLGRNLTRFVRPVYEMTHRKESAPRYPTNSVPDATTIPGNVRSKQY